MKPYRVLSLVMLGLLLLASSGGVFAQDSGPLAPASPQATLGTGFSYDGRLFSGSGGVTGLCDFEFSLWDALSGGAQVGGTQTANNVALDAGLFTLTLNGAGEFGSTAFDGQARWLAIAVRCPAGAGVYTPLAPRQALLATPYALYAQRSPWSGLTGVPAGFADGVDDVGGGGAAWQLTGNGAAASDFLGTTNAITLTLRVSNTVGYRLVPGDVPSLLGGYSGNTVSSGEDGAVIGGGGSALHGANTITDSFGVIGGGAGNTAAYFATVGGGLGNSALDTYATVGGGSANSAQQLATVGGGLLNQANAVYATVGGGHRNVISVTAAYGVIDGGQDNYLEGNYAVIGGGYLNEVTTDFGTVGGGRFNRVWDAYATIGGGYLNQATDNFATVGGGMQNYALATSSTVSGGYGNYADGEASTVGGGQDNTADGPFSFVGGGFNNEAGSYYATISGGRGNLAGERATVGGGWDNTASGFYATIGGGLGNVADADRATVGGGDANEATGSHSTVAGGYNNTASGDDATVGGGWGNAATGVYTTVGGGTGNLASLGYATVGGGSGNTAVLTYTTVAGGSSNDAIDFAATVGGGTGNQAMNDYATVGGGYQNYASGLYATTAGGEENFATGARAFIGGGVDNLASGFYSTVAGGRSNVANWDNTAVGGGEDNTASGTSSTVGGGEDNIASGNYATVPGGLDNRAIGAGSVAMGSHAHATQFGSFVFADVNTSTPLTNTSGNQFMVRTVGGVYFYTNNTLTTGCSIAAAGTGWNCVSDRNQKENFAAVDGVAVLNALMDMPIATWNLKEQDAGIRHLGPMAQDFYAAFGVGDAETTINSVDADGVALAAIQGLYTVVQEKEAALAEQSAVIAALTERVTALEAETPQPPAAAGYGQLLLGLVLGAGIAAGAFLVGRSAPRRA